MTDRPCPACGKPVPDTVGSARPFCSNGCRDRDLLAWLSDDYRLPGPATVQDGLDNPAEPD